MKKLIAGIMSLLVLGAMALPVAAQGRDWNRDNQGRNQRTDNRRDNNRFQWRNEVHRNDRFNDGRGREFNWFGSGDNGRRDRDRFRFDDHRFNHRGRH
jgi:hypothetical protein